MTANHIIVGQGPSSNGSVGSAHVYDATTGSYLYSLNNPSPDAADFFGQTVRTAGNRILIGAPGDDTVAEHAGAAYLFDATTGGLLHTFLPTGSTTSQFGFSLDINDSRIAVGSTSGSRVHLYDASTFALIQELPGVHLGDERFGTLLDIGGDRLFVHNSANRGTAESGEIQVFDATTGDLLPGFRVLPNDAGDVYTYTLLDDAGGRFSLDGNQLLVADGAAIDFETATSHTVMVQVTDSGGSTVTKSLTIDVIDANEPPTDIALADSTVAESKIRWVHNLQPEPQRAYGSALAVSGNRMLASDIDVSNPNTRPARVAVVDTDTGERLTTLVNPNPVPNGNSADGFFGFAAAISGNLAVIPAAIADIGNTVSAGIVYIFNMTTGGLVHTLTSPAATKLRFGYSVSAFGDVIAVGSSDDPQAAGAVYLFNATTGALLTTIPNPHPDVALDFFGSQLALSGNTLVIGAPRRLRRHPCRPRVSLSHPSNHLCGHVGHRTQQSYSCERRTIWIASCGRWESGCHFCMGRCGGSNRRCSVCLRRHDWKLTADDPSSCSSRLRSLWKCTGHVGSVCHRQQFRSQPCVCIPCDVWHIGGHD